MFCLKCGKEIDDDAKKCPYCDCPTHNAENNLEVIENTSSNQTANTLGILGIVFGAIGIPLAWLIALLGWMLGGAGLTLSFISLGKNKSNTKWIVGVVLSAIALVFACVNSVLGFLLAFV